MLSKQLQFIFLISSFSLFSQLKGKVVDVDNRPIPFVNIWVENENIGITTEENGEFILSENNNNKNLIFSALGYEKQTIKASSNIQVVLKSSEIKLDEVVVIKKLASKEIEIGTIKDKVLQAFDNGPKIDLKYFPYLPKYRKTKFISRIALYTDSKIDNATVKIHFYKLDSNGFPGQELLKKDWIVTLKKGTIKNIFSLENLNLVIPKDGVYVGIEKLLIQKNKFEKTVTNPVSLVQTIKTSFEPLLMIYRIQKPFWFNFSGGKWNKETNNSDNTVFANEPAIHLILSN